MLTAVVIRGEQIVVALVPAAEGEAAEEMTFEQSQDFCEFPFKTQEEFEVGLEEGHPCEEGPSPLAIEPKELIWGGASFLVLALLMRFWLFPAVKSGMDARYAHIRGGHEQAEQARAAARAEVADYETALAAVKSEANARIDAARQTLEGERASRLAEVNAAIAAKREAAAAEAAAARSAAQDDVAAAVADITGRTVELATGRVPDAGTVQRAVGAVMGAGVAS